MFLQHVIKAAEKLLHKNQKKKPVRSVADMSQLHGVVHHFSPLLGHCVGPKHETQTSMCSPNAARPLSTTAPVQTQHFLNLWTDLNVFQKYL